jgi:hypothetical protein
MTIMILWRSSFESWDMSISIWCLFVPVEITLNNTGISRGINKMPVMKSHKLNAIQPPGNFDLPLTPCRWYQPRSTCRKYRICLPGIRVQMGMVC